MTRLERFKQRIIDICGESVETTEYLRGISDNAVWLDMTDDDIARDFRVFCEEF